MIYALFFYWLVTGIALFMLPSKSAKHDFEEFVACLFLGGIVFPAALLVRVLT